MQRQTNQTARGFKGQNMNRAAGIRSRMSNHRDSLSPSDEFPCGSDTPIYAEPYFPNEYLATLSGSIARRPYPGTLGPLNGPSAVPLLNNASVRSCGSTPSATAIANRGAPPPVPYLIRRDSIQAKNTKNITNSTNNLNAGNAVWTIPGYIAYSSARKAAEDSDSSGNYAYIKGVENPAFHDVDLSTALLAGMGHNGATMLPSMMDYHQHHHHQNLNQYVGTGNHHYHHTLPHHPPPLQLAMHPALIRTIPPGHHSAGSTCKSSSSGETAATTPTTVTGTTIGGNSTKDSGSPVLTNSNVKLKKSPWAKRWKLRFIKSESDRRSAVVLAAIALFFLLLVGGLIAVIYLTVGGGLSRYDFSHTQEELNQGSELVKGIFRITNRAFVSALRFNSSQEYKLLSEELLSAVDDIFRRSSLSREYNHTKLMGFRNGSVISEIMVRLNDHVFNSPQRTASAFIKGLVNLHGTVHMAGFVVDLSSIRFTAASNEFDYVRHEVLDTNDIENDVDSRKILPAYDPNHFDIIHPTPSRPIRPSMPPPPNWRPPVHFSFPDQNRQHLTTTVPTTISEELVHVVTPSEHIIFPLEGSFSSSSVSTTKPTLDAATIALPTIRSSGASAINSVVSEHKEAEQSNSHSTDTIRMCNECSEGELCLARFGEAFPICRMPRDVNDQYGCGGWCDARNEYCQKQAENIYFCIDDRVCLEYEFQCRDGLCIPREKRCDGHFNCYDMTDEMDCVCAPGEFHCGKNMSCLPRSKRCDGNADCFDGTDEANCTKLCPGEQFTCTSGQCIVGQYFCDGFVDCDDRSDEPDGCAPGRCQDGAEFRCGNGRCVSVFNLCDGYDTCGDGSDESNCTLIDEMKPIADQVNWNCTVTNTNQLCDNKICIDRSMICDGVDNCGDNSDEKNCTGALPPPPPTNACEKGDFVCKNGRCIDKESKCDFINDCGDNSDEANCEYPLLNPGSTWTSNSRHRGVNNTLRPKGRVQTIAPSVARLPTSRNSSNSMNLGELPRLPPGLNSGYVRKNEEDMRKASPVLSRHDILNK